LVNFSLILVVSDYLEAGVKPEKHRDYPLYESPSIATNGPAIWGGCVTRREHRAGSSYFSQKAVTVQGGYGALFTVMVQILLSAGAVAVQV
jgi:hypothetical protein